MLQLTGYSFVSAVELRYAEVLIKLLLLLYEGMLSITQKFLNLR